MKRFPLVSACVLTAFLTSAPAAASVLVVGNSPGFGCYAAAKARSASAQALRSCDDAFASGMLTFQDEVATYVNRGVVKLYRMDHQGAVADFDKAIELNPALAESYLNKGSAYIRMGANPSDAIALLDEALARKTSHPEFAYFGRAVANEMVGNLPQAYRDYKRAQELAPRWALPGQELSRFQVTRASRQKM